MINCVKSLFKVDENQVQNLNATYVFRKYVIECFLIKTDILTPTEK